MHIRELPIANSPIIGRLHICSPPPLILFQAIENVCLGFTVTIFSFRAIKILLDHRIWIFVLMIQDARGIVSAFGFKPSVSIQDALKSFIPKNKYLSPLSTFYDDYLKLERKTEKLRNMQIKYIVRRDKEVINKIMMSAGSNCGKRI